MQGRFYATNAANAQSAANCCALRKIDSALHSACGWGKKRPPKANAQCKLSKMVSIKQQYCLLIGLVALPCPCGFAAALWLYRGHRALQRPCGFAAAIRLCPCKEAAVNPKSRAIFSSDWDDAACARPLPQFGECVRA